MSIIKVMLGSFSCPALPVRGFPIRIVLLGYGELDHPLSKFLIFGEYLDFYLSGIHSI
jgi:hypothetical protein